MAKLHELEKEKAELQHIVESYRDKFCGENKQLSEAILSIEMQGGYQKPIV